MLSRVPQERKICAGFEIRAYFLFNAGTKSVGPLKWIGFIKKGSFTQIRDIFLQEEAVRNWEL